MTSAADVATRFNDCINAGDLPGLTDLMSPSHTFVDSAGRPITSRDACTEAWREFFASFPGYRNVFESVAVEGSVVTVTGFSVCPGFPDLEGPAVWTVTTSDDVVDTWQVNDVNLADTEDHPTP